MAKAPADLRSFARAHTEMGVRVLAGIATSSENDSARVAAVALLFDRGWGKAPQAHTGPDGEGAIRFVVRHILEGAPAHQRPALEHAVADATPGEDVGKT